VIEFFQVDVFADEPYGGNPLAVFPRADRLTPAQMQRIAAEMNLAETVFVTGTTVDGYRARIFTVEQEMPFAGHPTIGTAWLLRHLGLVGGAHMTQVSGDDRAAITTPVRCSDDRLWFARTGRAEPDAAGEELAVIAAGALGLREADLGCSAAPLGHAVALGLAFADAGLRQLLVPVRDLDALGRSRIQGRALTPISPFGVLCFTPIAPGRIRARCFFPEVSVWEDPATGAAAASLGLYLADRIGPTELEVLQGVEMKRPGRIDVRAEPGRVEVGGRCQLIFRGELGALPRAPQP
jgi:trans-2,3-dihydro-3-hydroxyanthranilate isomerase